MNTLPSPPHILFIGAVPQDYTEVEFYQNSIVHYLDKRVKKKDSGKLVGRIIQHHGDFNDVETWRRIHHKYSGNFTLIFFDRNVVNYCCWNSLIFQAVLRLLCSGGMFLIPNTMQVHPNDVINQNCLLLSGSKFNVKTYKDTNAILASEFLGSTMHSCGIHVSISSQRSCSGYPMVVPLEKLISFEISNQMIIRVHTVRNLISPQIMSLILGANVEVGEKCIVESEAVLTEEKISVLLNKLYRGPELRIFEFLQKSIRNAEQDNFRFSILPKSVLVSYCKIYVTEIFFTSTFEFLGGSLPYLSKTRMTQFSTFSTSSIRIQDMNFHSICHEDLDVIKNEVVLAQKNGIYYYHGEPGCENFITVDNEGNLCRSLFHPLTM